MTIKIARRYAAGLVPLIAMLVGTAACTAPRYAITESIPGPDGG